MAKDGPNWDGLLKWSLAHSDGTRPNRNLRFSLSLSLDLSINQELRSVTRLCVCYCWLCRILAVEAVRELLHSVYVVDVTLKVV